jgi:hypothetical protein
MIPSSCKYNGTINSHIGTRPCILCNGTAQMMRPTLPVVVSPSTRFVASKYFMQFSFSIVRIRIDVVLGFDEFMHRDVNVNSGRRPMHR